jgi:hypothetical protein
MIAIERSGTHNLTHHLFDTTSDFGQTSKKEFKLNYTSLKRPLHEMNCLADSHTKWKLEHCLEAKLMPSSIV